MRRGFREHTQRVFTPTNGRNELCCAPGSNRKINMLMLLETGFDGAAKVRVDFCMATQNFIDRPIGFLHISLLDPLFHCYFSIR